MQIVNKIGDEGARRISEALKINTALTELNMCCSEFREKKPRVFLMSKMIKIRKVNRVGNEGAIMISEALKINESLTKLYLSSDDNEWLNIKIK